MDDIFDGTAFPRGKSTTPAPKVANDKSVQDDFLFGKKRRATGGDVEKSKQSKRTKKSTKSRNNNTKSSATAASAIPKAVPYLTFKQLHPGMKLFGVVKSINNNEKFPNRGNAIISLPNNLNGLVHWGEVCEEFASLAAGKAPATKDELPTVSEVLSVGDYVRCAVVAVEQSSVKKATANRMTLSLRPSVVNKGLSVDDLAVEEMLVYGAVKSVEDHGYIVDLGMGNRLTGFVTFAVAGGSLDEPALRIGAPLLALVADGKQRNRSVSLTTNRDALAATTLRASEALTFSSLQPGMLVNAMLKRVLPNGLWCSFLGFFNGGMDVFHLPDAASDDWDEQYKEQEKRTPIKARILFVDAEKRQVGLSSAPHVVQMTSPKLPPVGEVVDDAEVIRVDGQLGVFTTFQFDDKPVSGYAHLSKLNDDKKKVEHLDRKFKVGQTKKCRVVGVSPLDGMVNVSFQASVLEAAVLRYEHVEPGMLVHAVVTRIDSFGLIVTLGHGVSGMVTSMHLADTQVKDPTKRFKVGQSVKCKVLQVDVKTRKMQLTCKRTLVESELPMLKTYEDADFDTVTHGFVTVVKSFGVIVTFYDNVHGLVPADVLKAQGVDDPTSYYRIGQPVKVRVVNVNPKKQRMALSFRTKISQATDKSGDATSSASKRKRTASAKLGSLVSGIIIRKTEHDIFIRVDGSKSDGNKDDDVRGRIPLAHLSDHIENVGLLVPTFVVGSRVENALVLEIPTRSNKKKKQASGAEQPEEEVVAGADLPMVLSLKPSLVLAARHGALPSRAEQVHQDQMVVGFVFNVTPFGVFVRYMGGLTALAPRANISDDWVADPSEHCVVGQTVRTKVVDVDHQQEKIVVSLKPSIVDGRDDYFLGGLWTEKRFAFNHETAKSKKFAKKNDTEDDVADREALKHLKVGQVVEATILQVKEYGLILELKGGAVGFCMKEHAPKSTPKVSSKVQCRIMDLDFQKGVVDVTMRQRLVKSAKSSIPVADLPAPRNQKDVNDDDASSSSGEETATFDVTVELVKTNYAVVSLPWSNNAFAFAPTSTFNGKVQGFDALTAGMHCKARVFPVPVHEQGVEEGDPKKTGGRYGKFPLACVDIVADGSLGARRPRAMSDPYDAQILTLNGKHQDTLNKVGRTNKVKAQVGLTVSGSIHNIKKNSVEVCLVGVKALGKRKLRGRIQVADLQDPDSDTLESKESVLASLNVGDSLPACKIVGVTNTKFGQIDVTAVDVSLRKGDLEAGEGKVGECLEEVEVGETYDGWVEDVTEDGVWVALSRSVRGFVFCTDVSDDVNELEAIFNSPDGSKSKMNKIFPPGRQVRAQVVKNEERLRMRLV